MRASTDRQRAAGHALLLVGADARSALARIRAVETFGHTVDFASGNNQALHCAQVDPCDAVLVEGGCATASLTGCDLVGRLRGALSLPIIALLDTPTLAHTIAMFEAGADDVLAADVATAELDARVRALIRRHAHVAPCVLQVGDLELDVRTGAVRRQGAPLRLPPLPARVLSLLMREHPGVVTRAGIVQKLWGAHAPESDALRTHVHVLRKALSQQSHCVRIQNVPHVGYRIAPLTGDPDGVRVA